MRGVCTLATALAVMFALLPAVASAEPLGTFGSGNGQLNGPKGIAISATGGIYVVDAGNERIDEWVGPSPRVTKYAHDGDGNVETITDVNTHKTRYTYNGDNEPIKVEAPNGSVTETEYDGAGQVVKQIDGNKHATEYKRNAVEEVTEVINPLGKKTLKEYDAAGNLIKLTDPKGRTTIYTYDPANRLTEVSYSSGNPSTINTNTTKTASVRR
jgi:YD repeat-containing protein